MKDIIMEYKRVKEILEYAKTLKCEIIRVNDKIYGTDTNFAHLAVVGMTLNPPLEDMIFYTKDLAECIKNLDAMNYATMSNEINLSTNIHLYHKYAEMFDRLINTVYNYINIPVSLHDEDLKQNEDFNLITSMKAADGMGMLKLSDKYIISLFSGLLPINKSDKVKLYIRDVDRYRYLSNFTITKKKFSIDIFIMYLFLN